MSKRASHDPTEAIGTDAFLDIVANLVGILLILIMVIGVRMDDASQNAAISAKPAAAAGANPSPEPESELPAVEVPDVSQAQREVARLETSIRQTEQEASKLAQLAQIQKLDRDNMMLAVAHAERELVRRRDELDERQQARLALDLALQTSLEQRRSLIEQIESAQRADAQSSEVIQHVATPLAKTVFAREEHFRLKQGRLVYVPLNSMSNQLRSEAPKKMWKLKDTRQITETIGPEQGFYLRYTLRRNRIPIRAGAGIAAREIVELDRFVMVPVSSLHGESVDDALKAGSDFQRRLDAWDPNETIVTVWTYSDSFQQFRQLKRALYELGFLTAARPLPENQLISGSPHGTRSAAQ